MIVFRKAETSDTPFLLQAYEEIHVGIGDVVKLDRDNFLKRLQTDIFSDPAKAFVDVAEKDGAPVAMIMYSTVYFAAQGEVLWASEAYADKGHRGKMIYAIKRYLGDVARAKGISRIMFGTDLSKESLNRLWQNMSATGLNEHFAFWIVRV